MACRGVPGHVQLGVVGRTVCLESDDTGWWVSKIGGLPDYFARPPDMDVLCCRRCQRGLTLIVQLYCPVERSKNHRLLHMFTCLTATCQGHSESWLVLRSEMLEISGEVTQETLDENQHEGSSANDWLESADDWHNDMTENEDGADEDLQLFQAALDSRQQQRVESHSVTTRETVKQSTAIDRTDKLELPSFYINAIQEPYLHSSDTPTSHELELMRKYEIEHGISLQQMDVTSTSGEDRECYEKSVPAHGDDAFRKFYKRIQGCPQQCLRYERTGSPLCISNRPEQEPPKAIPPCPSCRATRVFELQLMPALVHILQKSSQLAENLDFGTVLVYTCSNSCWNPPDQMDTPNFRVEYAFVQSED